MWVLDHLDDLESDFSVFHRVEDIYSMPGPRFFKLAYRIFAYEGVMAARIMAEQEKKRPSGSNKSNPPPGRQDTRQVTLAQMQTLYPGIVERTVSSGG